MTTESNTMNAFVSSHLTADGHTEYEVLLPYIDVYQNNEPFIPSESYFSVSFLKYDEHGKIKELGNVSADFEYSNVESILAYNYSFNHAFVNDEAQAIKNLSINNFTEVGNASHMSAQSQNGVFSFAYAIDGGNTPANENTVTALKHQFQNIDSPQLSAENLNTLIQIFKAEIGDVLNHAEAKDSVESALIDYYLDNNANIPNGLVAELNHTQDQLKQNGSTTVFNTLADFNSNDLVSMITLNEDSDGDDPHALFDQISNDILQLHVQSHGELPACCSETSIVAFNHMAIGNLMDSVSAYAFSYDIDGETSYFLVQPEVNMLDAGHLYYDFSFDISAFDAAGSLVEEAAVFYSGSDDFESDGLSIGIFGQQLESDADLFLVSLYEQHNLGLHLQIDWDTPTKIKLPSINDPLFDINAHQQAIEHALDDASSNFSFNTLQDMVSIMLEDFDARLAFTDKAFAAEKDPHAITYQDVLDDSDFAVFDFLSALNDGKAEFLGEVKINDFDPSNSLQAFLNDLSSTPGQLSFDSYSDPLQSFDQMVVNEPTSI